MSIDLPILSQRQYIMKSTKKLKKDVTELILDNKADVTENLGTFHYFPIS